MPRPQRITRIETVMEAVRARITARSYVPGTRLPSVRAQAATLQVSVSTVVEAYARLTAEGLISPRPGAGFHVIGPVAPLALAGMDPPRDRQVDPLWLARQSLEHEPGMLKPGCGWLPEDWMYVEGIRRGLRSAARADAAALADYATPLGLPALRQLLARRLAGYAIDAAPEQIMLTESGSHAVDLICRFLLSPGDTVLVDDPCYFNFLALLKAHRVKVVGIPYTPTGPDVEAFSAALQAHSPRVYITNSGIHNPTGATLSPVTAHRLLSAADSSDLVIIEDDLFADFEHAPAPRLAAFDGLSRVIQVGSFSKTLSASVRCGFIVARGDWIEGLADLKIATSFGGGRLAADILLTALTASGYRRHVEAVRTRLASARDTTLARLAPLGIRPWVVPQAGMLLWCQLPDGVDAANIARRCLAEGVVLAPGNAFSPSLAAAGFLRFNAAQAQDRRVFEVLARAMRG
ncbi:PLP-dependent aminotransferase family protein [Stenotrophomonas sp. BIGb0135]|uniref:aminotransferase-like domain-containing protein n=1 Tax=Stenotrophomonas sp. BIGb0135 TaxID=2940620 RepID=UPI0021696808|nr:PLP-dependent aminotransferase family protein [Stenotrophomonas sp. BIGb0135]MCS4236644.1 DNA-binding transcriptional MocR family regulator [Stenotrophomonas sp. BIGb0135]